jgi:hypothetical protein
MMSKAAGIVPILQGILVCETEDDRRSRIGSFIDREFHSKSWFSFSVYRKIPFFLTIQTNIFYSSSINIKFFSVLLDQGLNLLSSLFFGAGGPSTANHGLSSIRTSLSSTETVAHFVEEIVQPFL